MMRSFIAIFSILFFLGGQAIADNCAGDCEHNGSHDTHSVKAQKSDHSCCPGMKNGAEDQETEKHNCSMSHCLLSSSLDSKPALLVTSESTTKDLNSKFLASTALTSLSQPPLGQGIALDRPTISPHPPKVPLYIYLQRLLISYNS